MFLYSLFFVPFDNIFVLPFNDDEECVACVVIVLCILRFVLCILRFLIQ